MGEIEEIKRAVSKLGADELAKFRAWFDKFDAARFDGKIERDAETGKLDRLADEALVEFRKGRARELLANFVARMERSEIRGCCFPFGYDHWRLAAESRISLPLHPGYE